MSAGTRLAKLEGALSPKEATLAWLAEAHQFPTLEAYVGWLVDQPTEAAPFWRVPEQAERAVRAAMRGEPRAAVEAAAHQTVRDAVFLVELVVRLNVEAAATIRVESLRCAALAWEGRAIGAEAELARRSRSRAGRSASNLEERWQAWCTGTAALLTGLYAAEEARALLERRYLDGHPALFPDAIADWERLRERAERLAGLGNILRPLMEGRRRAPGSAEIGPPDRDLAVLRSRARTQAPVVAARLVDEARAATLDVLGDTRGATAVVAGRLRARDDGLPASSRQ